MELSQKVDKKGGVISTRDEYLTLTHRHLEKVKPVCLHVQSSYQRVLRHPQTGLIWENQGEFYIAYFVCIVIFCVWSPCLQFYRVVAQRQALCVHAEKKLDSVSYLCLLREIHTRYKNE